MNWCKAILLVVVAFTLALGLAGCGTGSIPQTIQPLSVSTSSLPYAITNKTYSASLAAKGGVGPYTWNLTSGTLPAGITMASDGTFSGTATTKGQSKITVQVRDSQKPIAAIASSTSLTLNVNAALTITTTKLKVAAVNVPYDATLQANEGAPPYTWSITSGSLPAGLKLDSQYGVIYGTPTTQGSSTFTVQVADSEKPAVMVTQQLTLIVGGDNARFSGSYTFYLRGFKNGKLFVQAGTLVSDGMGGITGVTDIMSTSSVHTDVAVTGTYTVDNVFHGSATLSFGENGSAGTGSYQIVGTLGAYWAIMQNGNGQDTAYGSGVMYPQNNIPTDLSNSFGTFIFGGYGADSSDKRYGAAGTYTIASAGTNTQPPNVTSGNSDTNDNGTVSNNVTFSGSMTLPDSTYGRGIITLNSGINATIAYYYTDDNDFILIGTDPVSSSDPLILYNSTMQTTFVHIDNTILNGNGVVELSSAPSATAPDTQLALFSLGGGGTANPNSFWATIDENNGGTLTQSQVQGTYTVASSGRTTFTGWGSSSPIFWIANTDVGYILGTDAAVTFGVMEQQRPPNQNNTTFVNDNHGGTILDPVLPTQTVELDVFHADGMSPTGALTGAYDTSGPNGPMMALPLNATYTTPDPKTCEKTGVDFNTCGRLTVVDSNNKTIYLGYIQAALSPQRVVLMTTTSLPVINAIEQ
jgi:hypothetical protein